MRDDSLDDNRSDDMRPLQGDRNGRGEQFGHVAALGHSDFAKQYRIGHSRRLQI
jgi:hypothetical protein